MKANLTFNLLLNITCLIVSFFVAFFAASPLLANDENRQTTTLHFNYHNSLINQGTQSPMTIGSLREDQTPRFEIVFFPLSFFVSGLEAGIEFPVRERQHLRLSAGYFYSYSAGAYNNFGTISDNDFNYTYNEMEGFRTEAQYRFYWYNEGAYENFYVSPFAVFKSVNLNVDRQPSSWGSTGPLPAQNIELNSSAASFGVVFGVRAIMFNKVSLDVNLGGGITPINIGDYELAHIEQINPYRRSIHFKGGLTLGILIY
jgi:hypothetical protein